MENLPIDIIVTYFDYQLKSVNKFFNSLSYRYDHQFKLDEKLVTYLDFYGSSKLLGFSHNLNIDKINNLCYIAQCNYLHLLPNLTSLYLNKYSHCIDNLGELTNLTSLEVDSYDIFKEDLSFLVNLTNLKINARNYFNSEFINLTKLTRLKFVDNYFNNEECFSNLVNLTELSLTNGNQVSLANLTSLTKLSFINSITSLKYDENNLDLFKLTNLTELNIADSNFNFNGIPNLRKLKIRNIVCESELPLTLTSLDVDDCPNLSHLTSLTKLKFETVTNLSLPISLKLITCKEILFHKINLPNLERLIIKSEALNKLVDTSKLIRSLNAECIILDNIKGPFDVVQLAEFYLQTNQLKYY